MPKYLLQLGHCPNISYAEIKAVHDRLPGHLTSIDLDQDIAIAKSDDTNNIKSFCDELGGTIRAARILFTQPQEASIKDTLTPDYLIDVLNSARIVEQLQERSKRPVFGFSILGDLPQNFSKKQAYSLLHDTADLLKQKLKDNDISSRFVMPDPKGNSLCLSGAQVKNNNLIEDGMEICIRLNQAMGITIAASVWLQDYEEYSNRDYGRPGRDAHSGMLPPKLARILINLARTINTETVLDPFCGSGGIITEAGMMGLKSTGFDKSQKAVDDSINNWKWLQSNTNNATGRVRALEGDARQLHTLCSPLFFDCCATEPYLGPPMSKPIDPLRFGIISNELIPLYIRVLGEIRTVVKPGSRVVFVVPRFRLKENDSFANLRLLSEIKLLGYHILDPISDFEPIKGRTPLVYSRPSQVVQREIFVLRA